MKFEDEDRETLILFLFPTQIRLCHIANIHIAFGASPGPSPCRRVLSFSESDRSASSLVWQLEDIYQDLLHFVFKTYLVGFLSPKREQGTRPNLSHRLATMEPFVSDMPFLPILRVTAILCESWRKNVSGS